MQVGVAGAEDHPAGREQQVPGLEDVAEPGDHEDGRQEGRDVGERAAFDAEPGHAARSRTDALAHDLLFDHDAPQQKVHDHRHHQGRHE